MSKKTRKLIKDVEGMANVAVEKSNKEKLTEEDAKELLEALQYLVTMNKAMVASITGEEVGANG